MKHFEDLMSMVIKPVGNYPVYNCMLRVNDKSRDINFSAAKGLTGENGIPVSADFQFRTGSITKLFTAAIILQLIEEGFIGLNNEFFHLIDEDARNILTGIHLLGGNDQSNKITIRHLLQHESGLPDYFSEDERFVNYIIQHPSQSWNWKKVMEKYFEFELHLRPSCAPGNGFKYSDTNYLLLGILIEQITNKTLQQVYREKIIIPLGLTDTYLEFYEQPIQVKPIVFPYYGINSLEKINTSFDWGGGGLISTMRDLDIFIRGLAKGNLFKKSESLDLLMLPLHKNTMNEYPTYSNDYGLGIQKRIFQEYSFVGHTSAYSSMLFYEPEKEISIVLSLNQSAAITKAKWLLRKIVLEFPK